MRKKGVAPINQTRHAKSKDNKEDRSLAQRYRDTKKQLKALKRDYNRLVKEIQSGKYQLVEEPEENETIKPAEEKSLVFCGNDQCKSENTTVLPVPLVDGTSRKYLICQDCGHREAMKPKKL